METITLEVTDKRGGLIYVETMTQFPQLLKTWRKARRFSQLALAVEANVSTRHISFLETGRAQPSPDMVSRLGDALNLPLSARNQMLTRAGFAARHPARIWSDQEMAPIREAVEHTLKNHAPYPALALDRFWTVIRMNKPAKSVFGQLNFSEGDSLLDLMVSDALPPLIENWSDVAYHAAQRLRTESTAQGGVPELDRVAEKLAQVRGHRRHHSDSQSPVVPTIYKMGDIRLSLFATIAQFGTPEDLTLDDLKIELYFPADATTKQALLAMQGAA